MLRRQLRQHQLRLLQHLWQPLLLLPRQFLRRQRLQRRQTGATWQRNMLAQLRERMPLQEALHELLEVYMEHSERNLPVAEWPL